MGSRRSVKLLLSVFQSLKMASSNVHCFASKPGFYEECDVSSDIEIEVKIYNICFGCHVVDLQLLACHVP